MQCYPKHLRDRISRGTIHKSTKIEETTSKNSQRILIQIWRFKYIIDIKESWYLQERFHYWILKFKILHLLFNRFSHFRYSKLREQFQTSNKFSSYFETLFINLETMTCKDIMIIISNFLMDSRITIVVMLSPSHLTENQDYFLNFIMQVFVPWPTQDNDWNYPPNLNFLSFINMFKDKQKFRSMEKDWEI